MEHRGLLPPLEASQGKAVFFRRRERPIALVHAMFWSGIKFGMLLQLAVGPVCLFIFRTAVRDGVVAALGGALGATLVDSLFILLAVFGAGRMLESSEKGKKLFTLLGSLVLIVFGANCVAGAFGFSLLPSLNLAESNRTSGAFVHAVLLTASNPLTIVFWTGVFSAKVLEKEFGKRDLLLFSCGCLTSTVAFLSLIALAGGLTGRFIPEPAIDALNLFVGVIIIGFGAKKLFSVFACPPGPS